MADAAAQLGLEFDVPRRRRAAALRSFHAKHETAAEALAGEAKAQRQEAAIHDCVRYGVAERWTPSELATMFPAWPLTSIRRALTNLTARGLLRKHPEDRRPGPRGARECTWSLA